MPERTLELSAPAREITVHSPMTVPGMFAWALWRAPWRSEGALTPEQEASLGPVEVSWRGIRPDLDRVARYRQVCAHPDDGTLPATWLETLFMGPMATAIMSGGFPFSPLGIIHLRQVISPRRAIGPEETLDARCRMDAMRETERGFETDFRMELRAADEVAWTGMATVLSRNAATRGRTRSGSPREPTEVEEEGWRSVVVEISADLGRRYAAASGDYNPHHLYPLTSRLFGYKRPIAQGIWTLGRALAELEVSMEPPWTASVTWKRPVFLPGSVALRYRPEGETTHLEVRHATKGVPHLVGTVRPA